MARVTLEDDLAGGSANETVRLHFGPAEYEIDLSDANSDRFRPQLTPFVENTRARSAPASAHCLAPPRPQRGAGVSQRAWHWNQQARVHPGQRQRAARGSHRRTVPPAARRRARRGFRESGRPSGRGRPEAPSASRGARPLRKSCVAYDP